MKSTQTVSRIHPARLTGPLRGMLLGAAAMALLFFSTNAWAQGGLPTPQKGDAKKETQQAPKKSPLKKGDGWLGVSLRTMPAEKAKQLGHNRDLVVVDNVFTGSPAHSSGFKRKDIILKFNDTTIKEVSQIVKLVRGSAPGKKVSFTLLRDGKEIKKPLLLGVRPNKRDLLKSSFLDKQAPAFSVKRAKDDKPIKLSDYEGDVLLVDFWATWCGPCRATIPHLNKLNKKYKDKGLTTVGISDEDKSTLLKFMKKTPMNYQIAYDKDREANRDYLVSGYPTLFIIDHEGIVRDVVIGSGKMDEVDKLVDKLIEKRNASGKK